MYLELRNIGKIRHLIKTDCVTLLVSSLVLSKLDYCNSLLAGLPSERLKKYPNSSEQRSTSRFEKKSKRDSPLPLIEILEIKQLCVTNVFMAVPLLI